LGTNCHLQKKWESFGIFFSNVNTTNFAAKIQDHKLKKETLLMSIIETSSGSSEAPSNPHDRDIKFPCVFLYPGKKKIKH
jgi:hypothetical protein